MDKRKKDSFPSWVILIYGILETLKYVKIIPTMTVNIAGLILGLLSFLYTYRRKRLKGNYIIYFVIYTLMGLFSFIYNGNLDFNPAWKTIFFTLIHFHTIINVHFLHCSPFKLLFPKSLLYISIIVFLEILISN